MLEMLHITKCFGPLAALDDVSLRIAPGHVHGLLGENGAGKSTLMNILFGLLTPDAGTIRISSPSPHEVRISSPRAAQALGIGMVHQHFKLVPTLSVLENLALALHAPVKKIRPLARQCMEQLHWNVPLDAKVHELSVGQQQRVEILKALLAIQRSSESSVLSPESRQPSRASELRTQNSELRTHPSVLILDEPTAVLTPQETAELFTAINALKSAATAIVFISHKLAEVQKICDTVTILRRGKHIHTGPAADLSPDEMAQKMVGTTIELTTLRPLAPSPPRPLEPPTPPVLELDALTFGLLKNVSLQVHRGEILGIAGVDGNGQADLVQVIVGPPPGKPAASGGRLLIDSADASGRSTRWRADRLAYIPDDRHREALILPMSLQQNLLLKEYRRPPFSRRGFLRFPAWRSHAARLVKAFDIRCRSTADPAARLSGGNQQKAVLARELHTDALAQKPLVIAVNPTRGLDIGATAFVMRQLLEARTRGAAVLLIHSDLDELLALSDRLAVLYSGTLTPTPFPNATKETIGRLMLGLPAQ